MDQIQSEFERIRGERIQSLYKVKDYDFFSTASHGYLVIPKDDKNYFIASKIVTEYGYNGDYAIYLEEDCEASNFLKAIESEDKLNRGETVKASDLARGMGIDVVEF